MKRPSVLQVARTLPWHGQGGLETHSWELSRALQRRGWDVEILTTSFRDQDEVEVREGIRIHALRHLPLNRDTIPSWRWWNRFARRVRDYALAHRLDADVVHSESVYGQALFRSLARRRSRIGRVATLHGTGLQTYRETSRPRLLAEVPRWHWRAVGQWLYVKGRAWQERRRDLPSAQRLVAVSDGVADSLSRDYGRPPDGIEVIPNGILPPFAGDRGRVRAEFGIPQGMVVLLFLGRLAPEKRVERLIEHVRRHPEHRLLIAGSGPHESALRAAARGLENPAAVRFLGTVPDGEKQRILAAADALCLASDSEGQPITLLEALAAGTPVYARRPWVPAELAPLVATGDEVDAGIARALELSREVRAAAPRVATEYSWDRIAQRYEAAFERARNLD